MDSVVEIMKSLNNQSFLSCLHLMYGDKINKQLNGLTAAEWFVSGLKHTKFFEFESFIKDFLYG